LKNLREALNSVAPTNFPIDEPWNPLLFFLKLYDICSIFISAVSEGDKKKSNDSSNQFQDSSNWFFESNYGILHWNELTQTQMLIYKENVIKIDVKDILAVMDDLINTPWNFENTIKGRLFYLANCYWGQNAARGDFFCRYFIKMWSTHDDYKKIYEFIHLPRFMTFHLDFPATKHFDDIMEELKLSNEETLNKYLSLLIPEKFWLNRFFNIYSNSSELGTIIGTSKSGYKNSIFGDGENNSSQFSSKEKFFWGSSASKNRKNSWGYVGEAVS
jgi:hypothetical protein